VDRARKRTTLAIVCALCGSLFTAPILASGEQRRPAQTARGVCVREGAKLVGTKPVQAGRHVRLPKKIYNVVPTYPATPAGTVGTGGVWVGEALIDTHGKIAHVWTVRPVNFTPPFPKFNRAIADSIKEWVFEPPKIDGVPTPLCMPVTVNINWK